MWQVAAATLITAWFPAGSNPLHAYYSGDASYAPSNSVVVMQVINALPSIGLAFAALYYAGPNFSPTYSIAVGDF